MSTTAVTIGTDGIPGLCNLRSTPLPERDHRISLEDAAALTRAHRRHPILLEHPRMFRRETLDQLLAQPGCMGIRVYPAQHDDEKATLVIVGVDAMGNDLASGLLMQFPFECPPYCGEENPLNTD